MIKKSTQALKLRRKLKALKSEYSKLPRKSSFSGWDILDKIEKIERMLNQE